MTKSDKSIAKPALSSDAYIELRNLLELSLEALGEKPEDFTPDFLLNCVLHQRRALKMCHLRLQKLPASALISTEAASR